MATQDTSPSLIIGQHWSTMAEFMSANTDKEDNADKDGNKTCDSMKLGKQDMGLFGFCPSRDEFSLVVCEKCNLLVKPQALKQHIESRHGSTNLSSLGNIPASALNSELGKKLLMPLPTKCLTSSQTNTISTSSERQVSGTFKPMSTKGSLKQMPMSVKNVSAPILGVSMKISPIKSVKSGNRIITATTTATTVSSVSSNPVVKVEKLDKASSASPGDSVAKQECSAASLGDTSHNVLNLDATKISTLVNGSVKSVISLTSSSSTSTTTSSSLVSAPLLIAVTKTSADTPLSAKSVTTFVNTASGNKPLVIAPVMTIGSAVAPRPVSSSKSTKTQKDQKERKFLPCKDREYDANKHCGVTIAETGKQCTRSLTCKTHALSLRRAVPGRSKSFDDLLKEHKAAKEALLKARAESQNAALAASANRLLVSPTTINSTIYALKQQVVPMIAQRDGKLVHSASVPATPRSTAPSSAVPPETSFVKPGSVPNVFHRLTSSVVLPQSVPLTVKEDTTVRHEPSTRDQFSSLEIPCSEMQETKLHQNYLPHHPKPIANSQFAGRLSDKSSFLFSRKVDYIRAALLSALDIQLNPLPHKKLCVESNLPKESQVPCSSQDPYEFNMVDTSGAAAASSLSPSLVSSSKPSSKSKSKLLTPPVLVSSTAPLSMNLTSGTVAAPLSLSTSTFSTLCATPIAVSSAVSPSGLTLNWPVKSWDGVNSRSPSACPSPAASSTPAINSGKRKRSGSSGGSSSQFLAVASSNGAMPVSPAISAVNVAIGSGQQTGLSDVGMTANINSHQTTNLIAIPGVNLTGANLGQLTAGTPGAKITTANVASTASSHKNSIFKDFNLVLTGIDPSLVNGQYVNITGAQLAELAAGQGQTLFLNSFTSSGSNSSAPSSTTSSINLASSAPTSRPSKRSRSSGLKLHQTLANSGTKFTASSLEALKLIPSNSVLAGSLPPNAILMDSGSLQGAVLTSVALAAGGTSPALLAITSTASTNSGRTAGNPTQGSSSVVSSSTFLNGLSQPAFDKTAGSSSSYQRSSSVKPHHQHSKTQQQQHGIAVGSVIQASPSIAVGNVIQASPSLAVGSVIQASPSIAVGNVIQASPSIAVPIPSCSAAQLCSSQAIFKPGGTFSLAAAGVGGKLTMQPVSLKFPIGVSQAGLAALTSGKSQQQQQQSQHTILVAAASAASEDIDPASIRVPGKTDIHLQSQISNSATGNLIS